MNPSIWTWIQLAASLTNAAFLVVAHVPGPEAASEIANVIVARAGDSLQSEGAQRVASLLRQANAFVPGSRV